MSFCADVPSVPNRAVDLLPYQSSVLLSQPMNQRLNGSNAYRELISHLFVRREFLAVEGGLESLSALRTYSFSPGQRIPG
jgi:hypothetical protein